MSSLNRNPENTNPLQPTKFLLTFSRISTVQYFCQNVNLPGVSLGEVDRVTPFLDMFSPGTKLSYNVLDVSFIADAELAGWRNLYDWFTSIASPDGFEGRNISVPSFEPFKNFSDASLTILSSLNNPILRIDFTNLFPLSMSDIRFDTTASADTVITIDATFRYQSYKYLTV